MRCRPWLRLPLAALVAALVLLAGLVAPAAAQGEGGDTGAVAVNTNDGSTVFDLAFDIRVVADSVVNETNLAFAYASCSDCQTVALAFQVLFVVGDPEVVTPENVAIAINEGCSACETMAAAYQFVISTEGPVHFTDDGNRQIADIRRRLQELEREDLTLEQIAAAADTLSEELRHVLAQELVAAGESGTIGPPRVATATTVSPPTTAGDSTATTEPATTTTTKPDTTTTSGPTATTTAPPTTADPAPTTTAPSPTPTAA